MISGRILLILAQTWLILGSLSIVYATVRLFRRALLGYRLGFPAQRHILLLLARPQHADIGYRPELLSHVIFSNEHRMLENTPHRTVYFQSRIDHMITLEVNIDLQKNGSKK